MIFVLQIQALFNTKIRSKLNEFHWVKASTAKKKLPPSGGDDVIDDGGDASVAGSPVEDVSSTSPKISVFWWSMLAGE